MIEIWKDIKGYKGLYQVSNLGGVKNLISGKELKTATSNLKPIVVLFKKGLRKSVGVHILVAVAFLKHKQTGAGNVFVMHKDNDLFNNKLDNLELVTKEERMVGESQIRVRKADRTYYSASSKNEMFRNKYLVVKKDEYSVTFSVPSIDYNGKTTKTSEKKGFFSLLMAKDFMKEGDYEIDEEESNEDQVVILF